MRYHSDSYSIKLCSLKTRNCNSIIKKRKQFYSFDMVVYSLYDPGVLFSWDLMESGAASRNSEPAIETVARHARRSGSVSVRDITLVWHTHRVASEQCDKVCVCVHACKNDYYIFFVHIWACVLERESEKSGRQSEFMCRCSLYLWMFCICLILQVSVFMPQGTPVWIRWTLIPCVSETRKCLWPFWPHCSYLRVSKSQQLGWVGWDTLAPLRGKNSRMGQMLLEHSFKSHGHKTPGIKQEHTASDIHGSTDQDHLQNRQSPPPPPLSTKFIQWGTCVLVGGNLSSESMFRLCCQ